MDASIRPAYDRWPQYNRRLRDVVAALSPDELATSPTPDGWPIWATVGHTAAARVYATSESGCGRDSRIEASGRRRPGSSSITPSPSASAAWRWRSMPSTHAPAACTSVRGSCTRARSVTRSCGTANGLMRSSCRSWHPTRGPQFRNHGRRRWRPLAPAWIIGGGAHPDASVRGGDRRRGLNTSERLEPSHAPSHAIIRSCRHRSRNRRDLTRET